MRTLETKVNGNGDTHVLISKNEFTERWAEIKEGRLGKEVVLHFNSKFGGTPKHESIMLDVEDLELLAATAKAIKF